MIFRSHHQVPEAQTCPTITALLQEWVTINQSVEFTRQVPNLGPLFVTCTTPGDVVDLLDRTSYPHLDELLHALVKEGSYLAHRILLQAFLPKLLKKALKRAWLPNSGELDDHLQDCISDFCRSARTTRTHGTDMSSTTSPTPLTSHNAASPEPSPWMVKHSISRKPSQLRTPGKPSPICSPLL